MIRQPLIRRILNDYLLGPEGLHGVGHWARVLEIARCLAEQPGVRPDVLEMFAVLHDARRFGEGHDPGHGPRAAIYVAQLGAEQLGLDAEGLDLLQEACGGHTEGRVTTQPTIGACWDADRLDLPRAGILPAGHLLSTPGARDPRLIEWAGRRSSQATLPALVRDQWGLDLPGTAQAGRPETPPLT